MNKLKISIIIPTFNREKFIDKTLSSVFSTNDDNIEVIVVDNASTDNTLKKINNYCEDPRLKILVNEYNRERSYSRNLGMKHATGDFIAFLDSDDFISPKIFDIFRDFQKNNTKPNIFFSNYNIVDDNYELIKKKFINCTECDKIKISEYNYLSNISVFFHKKIINHITWDESPDLIGVEDYDFILRAIASLGPAIKFSNLFLASVCEHKNRTVNVDNIISCIKRYECFASKVKNHRSYFDYSVKLKKYIISNMEIYTALICCIINNRIYSIRFIYKAFVNRFFIIFDKRFLYVLIRIIKIPL